MPVAKPTPFITTPIKSRVYEIVNAALKSGVIERPDMCEIRGCHRRELTPHHDDYNQPFRVRWLCHSHHARWHVANVAHFDPRGHLYVDKQPGYRRAVALLVQDLDDALATH